MSLAGYWEFMPRQAIFGRVMSSKSDYGLNVNLGEMIERTQHAAEFILRTRCPACTNVRQELER